MRILYFLVAVIFLLVTLAEAGFFADAEGVVVGKKTFLIWGLPTGRRLLVKYQEQIEAETGTPVVCYYRVPVSYSIYEKFTEGDKLEHYKFSFVFFRNDESISFS